MHRTLLLVAFCSSVIIGCGLGDSCCSTPPVVKRDDISRDVVKLDDDVAPLREAFNAQSDRWRLVALVSPTCSECILGSEAVQDEITKRYSSDRLAAMVVWIPMLESDNKTATETAATIFPVGRVKHFYDGRRTVGLNYSQNTFSGFIDRARKSTPANHPLAENLNDQREIDRPQWDLYMLYAPGTKWGFGSKGPPVPEHWIRHCGRLNGSASTYWRDSPESGPLEGSLHDAMREMANDAIGPPT